MSRGRPARSVLVPCVIAVAACTGGDAGPPGTTARPCHAPDPPHRSSSESETIGTENARTFDVLVDDADGALVGVVVHTTGPKWNLPEGERYDVRKEYPHIPVYAETTICVERWLRNAGEFPQGRVVVVTVGGSISRLLTPGEARAINREAGDRIAKPGHGVTLNEPTGDAVFTEGDRVAVLVEDSTYRSFSGMVRAIRVWGGGAGAFVVESSGGLRNRALDISVTAYPPTIAAFERAVSGSGG